MDPTREEALCCPAEDDHASLLNSGPIPSMATNLGGRAGSGLTHSRSRSLTEDTLESLGI